VFCGARAGVFSFGVHRYNSYQQLSSMSDAAAIRFGFRIRCAASSTPSTPSTSRPAGRSLISGVGDLAMRLMGPKAPPEGAAVE
jgi:hypothetical protein